MIWSERNRVIRLFSSIPCKLKHELEEFYVMNQSPVSILGHDGCFSPVSVSVLPVTCLVYFRRYEESYFTRLPTTKQERHKARKMTTLGVLGDELTRFGDLRGLEGGAGASGSSGTSKKIKRFKGKKSKYLPSSRSSNELSYKDYGLMG
jgi:hypothetical protein